MCTLDYIITYLLFCFLQVANTSSNTTSCEPKQPTTHLSYNTQQELLDTIFILLNKNWSLLVMPDWFQVFDIVIGTFFDALSERQLSMLPLTISCEDYQTM